MINEITIILVSIIGAVATYIISIKHKEGPVKASALLSLIVGFVFYLFPSITSEYLSKAIPLAFIGASFVGMSSSKKIPNNFFMAFGGLVFGLIFLNTSKFFSGYGGALGTTACISAVITIGLMGFMKKH